MVFQLYTFRDLGFLNFEAAGLYGLRALRISDL